MESTTDSRYTEDYSPTESPSPPNVYISDVSTLIGKGDSAYEE